MITRGSRCVCVGGGLGIVGFWMVVMLKGLLYTYSLLDFQHFCSEALLLSHLGLGPAKGEFIIMITYDYYVNLFCC